MSMAERLVKWLINPAEAGTPETLDCEGLHAWYLQFRNHATALTPGRG